MSKLNFDILHMKLEGVVSEIFAFKDTVTFRNLSKIRKQWPVKFVSTIPIRNVVSCKLFYRFLRKVVKSIMRFS